MRITEQRGFEPKEQGQVKTSLSFTLSTLILSIYDVQMPGIHKETKLTQKVFVFLNFTLQLSSFRGKRLQGLLLFFL